MLRHRVLAIIAALPLTTGATSSSSLPTRANAASAYAEWMPKCAPSDECDWGTIAVPESEIRALDCSRVGRGIASCRFAVRRKVCRARFDAVSVEGEPGWKVARRNGKVDVSCR